MKETIQRIKRRVSSLFKPRGGDDMSTKVYVGNLPYTTTDADLTTEFSNYGTVTEARVIFDRETGRSKGFGFVTFAEASSVDAAVEGLNGQNFGGRTLKVSVAEDRPRGNGGGGGQRAGGRGYDNNNGGGYRGGRNSGGGGRDRRNNYGEY